jgi:biotin transport system permease protein/energy-coupling factor transport system permease protein
MLKLFLLLPLSVFCMSLPSFWLGAGIITAILTAFLCGFTLREQLTDIKPAVFYAALMYGLSVFSNLFERETLTALFIPRPDFLRISLRLALIVQLSALLFRTTSSVELRDGLCAIELFIRRVLSLLRGKLRCKTGEQIAQQSRLAQTISLFLSFIPEIFANWTSINLAWKARGGKQGLAKIKTLIFVLITLSFEKAAVKARALEARGGRT